MSVYPTRDDGLPSPVVGWIRNYAVTNYWRVSAFYELDDLCQDGLVCAVRCRNRYGTPGIDIGDRHFMSLVQVAFIRHLIDLTRRQHDTVYLADLGADEIAVREKHSPPEFPLGELLRCIEELPPYLYWVFRRLVTDRGFRTSRGDKSDLRSFLCDC